MFAVLSESAGVNPLGACIVFALKSRAALLDGHALSMRSKYVAYVGQMTFSNIVVFPQPPPPAVSVRGNPKSFGSKYLLLMGFVFPPTRVCASGSIEDAGV